MSEYYRIDDCPLKLPNPKLFPITTGSTVTLFENYLKAISDGFAVDFDVNERDLGRLDKYSTRWLKPLHLNEFIDSCKNADLLLSEPQYILDTDDVVAYILFAGDTPMAIQVKYYKYFRNRYPDCLFYSNIDRISVKAVMVGEKLIGMCMPIMLETKSREDIERSIEKRIEEERRGKEFKAVAETIVKRTDEANKNISSHIYQTAWNELYNVFSERMDSESMELMDSVLISVKLNYDDNEEARREAK